MNHILNITAKNVADFILSQSCPDCEDYISNLKLQKLLYYCQGFHLAIYGKPLFPEKIIRWQLGPVVPDVYQIFKGYSRNSIPMPEDFDFSMFTVEQKELMIEVYKVYAQYSAWRLRDMTHEEPPYLDTVENEEISNDRLISFFKTQIK